MHVVALLADHQLLENRLGRYGISHADAGRDDLGEGAGVNHDAVGVKALDVGQVLAAVAQIAVGVVLQNQHAVFLGELIHSLALFKAHRHAGGILEIRDGVDEFGVGRRLQLFFKLGHAHAVGLNGHADELGVVAAEGVQRTDKGRRFNQHYLALVYKRLGAQIHDLLCAGGDQNIVVVAAGVVLALHVVEHVLPQRRVALGHAVLQNGNGILFEHLRGNLLNRLCRERVGRGIACRKRHYGGVGGIFENLADGAGLQVGNPVGKFVFHNHTSFP